MEKQEPDFEARYQQELLLSRKILKLEMQKAIRAYSPDEKRALAARWKTDYSPMMAKELLRVARDPQARSRIADWNLGDFDNKRMGNGIERRSNEVSASTAVSTYERKPFRKKLSLR